MNKYEIASAGASVTLVLPAEGYYNFENNKYIYSYNDHLGNVRLSYTKGVSGAEIIEENNYYPFGLKHEGYNPAQGNTAYQYKYNGKELQTESGMYDYGARFYMPDIGRWGVVDPLAETTTRVNPYNYALNNPVMFIDPDGRRAMFHDTNDAQFEGGGISQGGFANYFANGGHGGIDNLNDYLGNTGPGWRAGYPTFRQTSAYRALLSGDTSRITSSNGFLYWNTLDPTPSNGLLTNGSIGGVSAHSMKIGSENNYSNIKWHDTSQTLRKIAGYAFTFSQLVEAGYKHASVYGAPRPYSTMSLYFEKSILGKKVLSLKLPFRQVNADKALKWAGRAKAAGTALGVVGVGLGVYDISQNGFTTSNTLDTAMSALAVTPTGVTQGIAGTYFILNAASSIITGKDIGQHLDENGYNLGELINNIGK